MADMQLTREEWNRIFGTPEPEKRPGRTIGGTLQDIGVTLGNAAIGAGESVVGLANLATGGLAGKGMNALGYDPKAAREYLSQYYSDAQKAANKEVNDAQGFWDTTAAMLRNPSTIAATAVESAPSMYLGGGIGRRLLSAATGRLAKAAQAGSKSAAKYFERNAAGELLKDRTGQLMLSEAGRKALGRRYAAVGEGAIAGGALAEQMRQEDPNKEFQAKHALYGGLGGAITGGIGRLGSGVANRMGVTDVDTLLTTGLRGAAAQGGGRLTAGQIAKGIGAGALTEGVFEELPQSMQEEIWTNLAAGRPWNENVGKAGAQGMMAGFVMGAGANARAGMPKAQRELLEAQAAQEREIRDAHSRQLFQRPQDVARQMAMNAQAWEQRNQENLARAFREAEEQRSVGVISKALNAGGFGFTANRAPTGPEESLMAQQQSDVDLTREQRVAEYLGKRRDRRTGLPETDAERMAREEQELMRARNSPWGETVARAEAALDQARQTGTEEEQRDAYNNLRMVVELSRPNWETEEERLRRLDALTAEGQRREQQWEEQTPQRLMASLRGELDRRTEQRRKAEEQYAQDHGLEYTGDTTIPANALVRGDRVQVRDAQGRPDIARVQGSTDDGRIILQDGVRMAFGEDEDVPIQALSLDEHAGRQQQGWGFKTKAERERLKEQKYQRKAVDAIFREEEKRRRQEEAEQRERWIEEHPAPTGRGDSALAAQGRNRTPEQLQAEAEHDARMQQPAPPPKPETKKQRQERENAELEQALQVASPLWRDRIVAAQDKLADAKKTKDADAILAAENRLRAAVGNALKSAPKAPTQEAPDHDQRERQYYGQRLSDVLQGRLGFARGRARNLTDVLQGRIDSMKAQAAAGIEGLLADAREAAPARRLARRKAKAEARTPYIEQEMRERGRQWQEREQQARQAQQDAANEQTRQANRAAGRQWMEERAASGDLGPADGVTRANRAPRDEMESLMGHRSTPAMDQAEQAGAANQAKQQADTLMRQALQSPMSKAVKAAQKELRAVKKTKDQTAIQRAEAHLARVVSNAVQARQQRLAVEQRKAQERMDRAQAAHDEKEAKYAAEQLRQVQEQRTALAQVLTNIAQGKPGDLTRALSGLAQQRTRQREGNAIQMPGPQTPALLPYLPQETTEPEEPPIPKPVEYNSAGRKKSGNATKARTASKTGVEDNRESGGILFNSEGAPMLGFRPGSTRRKAATARAENVATGTRENAKEVNRKPAGQSTITGKSERTMVTEEREGQPMPAPQAAPAKQEASKTELTPIERESIEFQIEQKKKKIVFGPDGTRYLITNLKGDMNKIVAIQITPSSRNRAQATFLNPPNALGRWWTRAEAAREVIQDINQRLSNQAQEQDATQARRDSASTGYGTAYGTNADAAAEQVVAKRRADRAARQAYGTAYSEPGGDAVANAQEFLEGLRKSERKNTRNVRQEFSALLERMRKQRPGPETEAMIRAFEARAKAMGLSTEEFAEKIAEILGSPFITHFQHSLRDMREAFAMAAGMPDEIAELATRMYDMFDTDMWAAGHGNLMDAAEQWAGIPRNVISSKKKTEAVKKFAGAFNEYLRSAGEQAPNAQVKEAFFMLRGYLKNAYQAVKQSPQGAKTTLDAETVGLLGGTRQQRKTSTRQEGPAQEEFIETLRDTGEVVNALGQTFRLVELKNKPGMFRVEATRENGEVVKITNRGMSREDAAKKAWETSASVEASVDFQAFRQRQVAAREQREEAERQANIDRIRQERVQRKLAESKERLRQVAAAKERDARIKAIKDRIQSLPFPHRKPGESLKEYKDRRQALARAQREELARAYGLDTSTMDATRAAEQAVARRDLMKSALGVATDYQGTTRQADVVNNAQAFLEEQRRLNAEQPSTEDATAEQNDTLENRKWTKPGASTFNTRAPYWGVTFNDSEDDAGYSDGRIVFFGFTPDNVTAAHQLPKAAEPMNTYMNASDENGAIEGGYGTTGQGTIRFNFAVPLTYRGNLVTDKRADDTAVFERADNETAVTIGDQYLNAIMYYARKRHGKNADVRFLQAESDKEAAPIVVLVNGEPFALVMPRSNKESVAELLDRAQYRRRAREADAKEEAQEQQEVNRNLAEVLEKQKRTFSEDEKAEQRAVIDDYGRNFDPAPVVTVQELGTPRGRIDENDAAYIILPDGSVGMMTGHGIFFADSGEPQQMMKLAPLIHTQSNMSAGRGIIPALGLVTFEAGTDENNRSRTLYRFHFVKEHKSPAEAFERDAERDPLSLTIKFSDEPAKPLALQQIVPVESDPKDKTGYYIFVDQNGETTLLGRGTINALVPMARRVKPKSIQFYSVGPNGQMVAALFDGRLAAIVMAVKPNAQGELSQHIEENRKLGQAGKLDALFKDAVVPEKMKRASAKTKTTKSKTTEKEDKQDSTPEEQDKTPVTNPQRDAFIKKLRQKDHTGSYNVFAKGKLYTINTIGGGAFVLINDRFATKIGDNGRFNSHEEAVQALADLVYPQEPTAEPTAEAGPSTVPQSDEIRDDGRPAQAEEPAEQKPAAGVTQENFLAVLDYSRQVINSVGTTYVVQPMASRTGAYHVFAITKDGRREQLNKKGLSREEAKQLVWETSEEERTGRREIAKDVRPLGRDEIGEAPVGTELQRGKQAYRKLKLGQWGRKGPNGSWLPQGYTGNLDQETEWERRNPKEAARTRDPQHLQRTAYEQRYVILSRLPESEREKLQGWGLPRLREYQNSKEYIVQQLKYVGYAPISETSDIIIKRNDDGGFTLRRRDYLTKSGRDGRERYTDIGTYATMDEAVNAAVEQVPRFAEEVAVAPATTGETTAEPTAEAGQSTVPQSDEIPVWTRNDIPAWKRGNMPEWLYALEDGKATLEELRREYVNEFVDGERITLGRYSIFTNNSGKTFILKKGSDSLGSFSTKKEAAEEASKLQFPDAWRERFATTGLAQAEQAGTETGRGSDGAQEPPQTPPSTPASEDGEADGVGAQVETTIGRIRQHQEEIRLARRRARVGYEKLDTALIESSQSEIQRLTEELKRKLPLLHGQQRRLQREIDEAEADSNEWNALRRDRAQVNYELQRAEETIYEIEEGEQEDNGALEQAGAETRETRDPASFGDAPLKADELRQWFMATLEGDGISNDPDVHQVLNPVNKRGYEIVPFPGNKNRYRVMQVDLRHEKGKTFISGEKPLTRTQAIALVKEHEAANQDWIDWQDEMQGDARTRVKLVARMEKMRAERDQAPAESAPKKEKGIADKLGEHIGGSRADMAKKTGPREKLPGIEDYDIREGEDGQFVVFRKGKPLMRRFANSEEAKKYATDKVIEENFAVMLDPSEYTYVIYARTTKNGGRGVRLGYSFTTMEQAKDAIRENLPRLLEERAEKIKGTRRPKRKGFGEGDLATAETSERIGKERRAGDATPEDFMSAFGFRGVEFGLWNNQQERQALLNDAYDALMDLADLLGIPPKALSLNGELALAFGARGKGGKKAARAHYEPDKVVINLTKNSGKGTLAHEWMHALDYYFGGRGESKGPLSEHFRGEPENVRPEVYEAFRNVKAAIFGKNGWTNFYEAARRFRNTSYWANNREMLARAFSAYIEDTLKERGEKSDFLSYGSNNDLYGEEWSSKPFPEGEERQAINRAFAEFFGTLKVDDSEGRAALYSKTGRAVPPEERANIEAELRESLGRGKADELLGDKGSVRIIETQEEARELAGRDNPTVKRAKGLIQGFYLNGVAYLVRDGIAKGNVMGVLMHEYGEHAAQLGFADNLRYRAILKSLENRQNKEDETGTAIQAAMQRARDAGTDENDPYFWREVSAYLVETNANVKTTALDRVTHFFKKWLFKVSGLGADNFTHKDLVMFAKAAVKAGRRVKQGGNARLSFTGVQGAAALDAAEEVTTRLDNLAVARDMEAAGKDAKAIKFATGWERGKDGKWRYEIDDSGTRVSLEAEIGFEYTYPGFKRLKELENKFITKEPLTEDESEEYNELYDRFSNLISRQYDKVRNGNPVSLPEMLDAPELFKAYPQLKKTTVVYDYMSPNTRGNYSPTDNRITLNRTFLNNQNEKQVRSTLHHEIQHAIQEIEGFAQGGMNNEDTRLAALVQAGRRLWKHEDTHNEFVENAARRVVYNYALLEQRYKENPASFERSSDWLKYKPFVVPKNKQERLEAIEDAIRQWRWDNEREFHSENFGYGDMLHEAWRMSSDELKSELKKLERRNKHLLEGEQEYRKAVWEQNRLDLMNPLEVYRALAGETEARNVQARLNMTAEERRASLASETEDVAREDQIVLEEMLGGTAANIGPRFSIAASSPAAPAANPAANNTVTGQSFVDRILANAKPKYQDMWERFIYNFIDNNDPRERVWKRAGSPTDQDFVTVERLRGKKTAAEQRKFREEMVTPLLKTLAQGKLAVSDLEEYAYAMHTPERNRKMREVNAKRNLDALRRHMPRAEAQDLQDRIDFVRTVGKANGWTQSDIQNAYLGMMEEVFRDIPRRETLLAQAQANLTAASSNNARAHVDKMRRDLDETKALRDRWRRESVRFAGQTDQEAQATIQKWQRDGRFRALQNAHNQLEAITAATLDVLHESGYLSDEEFLEIKNGYQHYVPLHRDGFLDTTPIKLMQVAKGSMRDVVNILPNVVRSHETAVNRKHKAAAGRALYDFAEANPDAGISIEEMEMKPTHDQEGNIVMYRSQAEPEDGIFVRVNGKKYLLRFAASSKTAEGRTLLRFLDSVKGSDRQMNSMVRALHWVTKSLAMVNTSLSPEFMVTNFARDLQTAFVHLNQKDIDMPGLQKAVAHDVFPAMRGIWAAERGDKTSSMAKWYADFQANGGKVGWMQGYEEAETLAKDLQKELKLYQPGNHGRKAFNKVKQLVEHGNAAIENCMRLATYKNLVERGVSKDKAARIASSLTVDFTQHGKMGPQINALYMFWNASVQGSVRMIQALASSKEVRAIAGGIASAGFLLQMLALAGGGDDDSGEPYVLGIPDAIRERNIIIMLPGSDGKYVKIPKAYGYGALYDFGAEVANSLYMGAQGRKYDHTKGAMRVINSFANSFNPVHSATMLQTLAPTLLDPVAYVSENKSWMGTPLMPEQNPYGPPKPDAYRAWKGTSPIFKKMSESWSGLFGGDAYAPGKFAALTDISPETWSMLWDNATGGMGRFIGNTLSLPFTVAAGDTEAHKIPFARTVYGEWNDRAISSRYYEAMDRAEIAHMRFKNAESLPERKRLYQEPDHQLYLQSRKAEAQIKKLRKRQQQLEAAGNKDGAERIRTRIVAAQSKVLAGMAN